MLLENYLPRVAFDSYEDFRRNFQIEIPENFNFAYDVVDRYAAETPDKVALVWCDDFRVLFTAAPLGVVR